ncbi:MAG: sulfite exporter TauE/SafE family protein [Smithellaceae bacterium]|nr:sulfite exporter TauE/SafE family protein [Syntrophaceae bacterium]MDD4240690.1 sulfite exporter TauE/SafE family protein [Smithellaceae bacterium]NLX52803.1 sulfite exporter TauE/SafE family protein [Deltaproteobacteria bacterium]
MKTTGISFAIGLAAGLFGGLIGMGGGIVMIPLLVGWFALDQCRAQGTSLAVLVFTGVSGALTYGYAGQIDWNAALILAVPAVLTAAAGARLADRLPGWQLKKVFGAFLIFCAVLLLLKPVLASPLGGLPDCASFFILLVTGAVTGFLSGLIGVGGGAIMVPALILLAGFTQHAAQGTSLLVMIPTGLAGAFTHWRLGNVAGRLLVGMVPGILLGAFFGGITAQFIPEAPLRCLFVLAAIYMGWRYARAAEPASC